MISLADIRKQVASLQVAERFFESAVLFAMARLGTFRLLAERPMTHEELHAEIGGDGESLRAIHDAAVALKVLSIDAGRFAAPPELLDCLGRPESPAYLGEWVEFLHVLAAPLLQLDEAVKTGVPPGALFEDMQGDNLPAKRMTRAMDAYARTRGVDIVEHLDFSDTASLLDLGCGPGTYSVAIAERFPNVRATLLDLPGPIAEARRIAAERGVGERLTFIAADATEWETEQRFDAVLVSNTLHMLPPDVSRALLKRCYGLVSPGGRLIVQAQYLHDDRRSPRWPTLLNLIQRVATPGGRNHAIGETMEWVRAAGFDDVRHVYFSAWNVCSAVIGHRRA